MNFNGGANCGVAELVRFLEQWMHDYFEQPAVSEFVTSKLGINTLQG
jgi:hypothetical protein